MKPLHTRAALCGLLAALALLLSAAPAVADQAGRQKIYLDPDTGAVLSGPAARAADAQSQSAVPAGAARKDRRAPRAWTNDDGADMLTTDPLQAPTRHAVRCPDGSLRIGTAPRRSGQSARAALCTADHE